MHEKTRLKNWKAPNRDLLPDFIIGGAMKSGTSTLHQILARHPKVFIPQKELGFFDIDNPLEHSDYNYYDKSQDRWITQTMVSEKHWPWYENMFIKGRDLMKGEDSTTYLASEVAAERIGLQDKKIKMLFLLRHPTARAYSNYHHLVRTGRAMFSFEETLQFNPYSVLHRSLYKEQLAAYYKHLSPENIKVTVFEDFIKNIPAVTADICRFLELDFSEMPQDALDMHANPALIPTLTNLQIKRNKIMRGFGNSHYTYWLPNAPETKKTEHLFTRGINKAYSIINPLRAGKPPKIKKSTKAFLDEYFLRETEGIDELTGQNILSKWFDTE